MSQSNEWTDATYLFTSKWLLSFMHWHKMFVYFTLLIKDVITNVTIKWMNWYNMFVHIQMASLLHALAQHVCSSYSFEQSCNHKCHNQMNEQIQHVCVHPKGFSPSRTSTTCLFMWLFWENLWLQASYLNGFTKATSITFFINVALFMSF